MKTALLILISAIALTACKTPSVTAGYYINNSPDSKTTLLIGTNNTQANALHGALPESVTPEGIAEADATAQKAKANGLFVNNTIGNRSADIDATAALERLSNVQGSSAGQTMNTTKGDSSPATGTQEQTPTNSQTKTTNIPTAISQQGANASTAEPDANQNKE